MSANGDAQSALPPAKPRLRLRWVLLALTVILVPLVIAYVIWQPGAVGPLPPGRAHGAWLTHAWWGSEEWFADSQRHVEDYTGTAVVTTMASRLHGLGIRDWYVHAGPARPNGSLPSINAAQARLLVQANRGGQVLAWIGGVLDAHCTPEDPEWRDAFARSCATLVRETGIAGIQLNIEPCPSFTPGYLELLDALKAALPSGARLSIAAYPPPSWLHPAPSVHWNEEFIRAVSGKCDDLCVMAYDTGQRLGKPYTWLVRRWTSEVLQWSTKPVRIGLPAYAEFGKPWHRPEAENLSTALPGLARALQEVSLANYAGWAVYAEWTMTAEDEHLLRSYQPDASADQPATTP